MKEVPPAEGWDAVIINNGILLICHIINIWHIINIAVTIVFLIKVDESELSRDGGVELHVGGSGDGGEFAVAGGSGLSTPGGGEYMDDGSRDSTSMMEEYSGDESLPSDLSVNSSLNTSRNKSTIRFKCPHCNKACLRAETLAKHLESHKEKDYKCNSCPFVGGNYDDLRDHRRVHMSKKCQRCDFSTNRADALKRHQMNHQSSQRPRDISTCCNMCDFTSKNALSLKNHVKYHHDKFRRNAS